MPINYQGEITLQTAKFVELIIKLEERGWQYSVTHEDQIEIFFGNQLEIASKFDNAKIQRLIDEVDNW